MARLEPNILQQCFFQWMSDVQAAIDGDIIAIDGKSLRRSFDKASRKNALHMVSAWSCAGGVALGQVKTDEKSNEITAIPRLLDLLEIRNGSRIRRGDAPENMAVLRRLALNICKRYVNGDSNPKKLKKAGWDDSFRKKLLFATEL